MAVIDYKEQSNEVVALNVMLSVFQGHAPMPERQIIASNSLAIAGNYNKMKEVLTSHKTSSQRYGADGLPVHDSGPAPMDVGCIEEDAVGGIQQKTWDKNDKYGGKYGKQGYYGKKGSFGGKAYGKFGKNGEKGDKYGKYGKKGDKAGKSGKKSSDSTSDSASQVSGAEAIGGSSGGSTYFAGYGGECWMWGHKRKDCWYKGNTEKTAENGCGYIENATEEWESGSDIPDGENVLRCVGIGDNKPMNKAEKKIVAGVEKGNQWLISLDSGSDDHCCMVDFGMGRVVENGTTLNDVGYDSLGCFGQRNVKYVVEDVDGKDVICNTDFTVGKRIKRVVLSMSKFCNDGRQVRPLPNYKVRAKPGQHVALAEMKGREVPVWKIDNSLYEMCKKVVGGVEDTELKESKYRGMEDVASSNTSRPTIREVMGPEEDEATDPEMPRLLGPHEQTDSEDEGPAVERGGQGDELQKEVIGMSSTQKVMKERCRELGLAIYGDKHTLLARILKEENQLAAAKQIRSSLEQRARRGGTSDAYVPQMLSVPDLPREQERLLHEVAHLPPQPWCVHCQIGRGTDPAHGVKLPTELRAEKPRVEFDYMYLNADGQKCDPQEAVSTTLVGVGCTSGTPFCVVTPSKEANYEYLTAALADFIRRLNHFDLVIRSDGEPVLVAMIQRAMEALPHVKWKPEKTQRYDPQAIGTVAAMQRLVAAQVRTVRHDIETMYLTKISPDHRIWPWICRNAAWQIERMHVEMNGHTAFRDTTGSPYSGFTIPMGETVLYQVPHSASGEGMQIGS